MWHRRVLQVELDGMDGSLGGVKYRADKKLQPLVKLRWERNYYKSLGFFKHVKPGEDIGAVQREVSHVPLCNQARRPNCWGLHQRPRKNLGLPYDVWKTAKICVERVDNWERVPCLHYNEIHWIHESCNVSFSLEMIYGF